MMRGLYNCHKRTFHSKCRKLLFVLFITIHLVGCSDHESLAFISSSANIHKIVTFDVTAKEVTAEYELPGIAINFPMWSLSGNRIMTLTDGPRFRSIPIFSLDGDEVSIDPYAQPLPLMILRAQWGSDDETIYLLATDTTLQSFIFRLNLSDYQINPSDNQLNLSNNRTSRLDATVGAYSLSMICNNHMMINRFEPDGDRIHAKFLLNLENDSMELVYSYASFSEIGGGQWSDDCSKFGFVVEDENETSFVIIEISTGTVTNYQISRSDILGYDWSPDGSTVVLTVGEPRQFFRPDAQSTAITNLARLDLGTEAITMLTNGSGTIDDGTWSPSGKYIAYSSNESGSLDIFSYGIECMCSSILYSGQGDEFGPVWLR